MQKRVLITGATGFIGRRITESLIRERVPLRLLVRRRSRLEELEKYIDKDERDCLVQCVEGDITVAESIKDAVRDCNTILHLAAQLGEWNVPEEYYFKVNVEGTRSILKACAKTGVKNFIYCSTPGVLGKGHRAAKEDMPYNPGDSYEWSKCEAEKLVLDFTARYGFRSTIVRPDFVYGPGDFRRIKLYLGIKSGTVFLIGKGDAILHPTYVDDVARGIIEILYKNSTASGVFNLAGPRAITMKEYFESIAEALDVRMSSFRVPKTLALGVAVFLEGYSRLRGTDPPLTRNRVRFLTTDHASDISKTARELGIYPRVEFTDGIKETISWCRTNRLL